MKSNYFKLLALTGTLVNFINAQDAQFTATITNNLPYTIKINDRKWEGTLVEIATLQTGQTTNLSDLSTYTQSTSSQSNLIITKDGTDIAEIILLKQFGYENHKPAVIVSLVPFPHWIGGSKFIREELDQDTNVFNVQIDLKQDKEETLEPTKISVNY